MKSLFRKIRHQAITKNLLIPKDSSVLDTSCQDSGFLSVLNKNNLNKNLKLFGVDISESDISKAKNLVPNGIFEITDNKRLPFADNTFDVVISSLTLHHMNDPMSSLLEMKRVIKETGSIYLIDIIAEGKLFNSILKTIKCPEPYHFEKFYSLKEVEELVIKSGLRINTKKKVFVFPTFTITTPVLILELVAKSFEDILKAEGFPVVYNWYDEPGTKYENHKHQGKVSFFVLEGSVTFSGGINKTVSKRERIDVPVRVEHSAIVGNKGCRYVVGQEIEGDA